MKSDKKQTLVLIGIALLIAAGIMLYVTLSAPRVYENAEDFKPSDTALFTEETVTVKYPLNLNTATARELATVEGLSEEDAYSIVEYRKKIGRFSDISEIMNVKGIGETKYNKALPYVTV